MLGDNLIIRYRGYWLPGLVLSSLFAWVIPSLSEDTRGIGIVPPAVSRQIWGGQTPPTCPTVGSPGKADCDLCDLCGGPVSGRCSSATPGDGQHTTRLYTKCYDPNDPTKQCGDTEECFIYCDLAWVSPNRKEEGTLFLPGMKIAYKDQAHRHLSLGKRLHQGNLPARDTRTG